MYKEEITKKMLEDRYTTYKKYFKEKNLSDSDPEPLFTLDEDGWFNESNWMSNQDLLRMYCNKLLDKTGYYNFYITDRICSNTTSDVFNVNVYFVLDEEQKTFILFVTNEMKASINEFDAVYSITWYKERGCTEAIRKNGCLINRDDYLTLLNIIRHSDYFQI